MARRTKTYDFDLIVLGSGGGGSVAAVIAADSGKKVALVESDDVGGECPKWGCIPTKALLYAAKQYQRAKEAKAYGVRASTLNLSLNSLGKWRDKAIERTGIDTRASNYEARGIKLIMGHAHFLSPEEISVGNQRFSAKKFLIATGAHPAIPHIEGLSEAGFLTHREAIMLKKTPKSIFIIGGGGIGSEFAQLFSILGSKVALAEKERTLLPHEDEEVGLLVADILQSKYKATIHTETKVRRIYKEKAKKVVEYEKDGNIYRTKVDELLVATGVRPNTDIGLENAGVEYSKSGILANEYMQTTTKHIYTAGDVTGPYHFTHTATYQSKIAAHNMYSQKKNWVKADYHAVPRVIHMDPEVASVGLSEKEAKDIGIKVQVGVAPLSILARANTSDQNTGFVKVVADDKGLLLGGVIVAPRAGDMIHELAIGVHNQLPASAIASAVHAFPTWSEAIHVACQKIS